MSFPHWPEIDSSQRLFRADKQSGWRGNYRIWHSVYDNERVVTTIKTEFARKATDGPANSALQRPVRFAARR